MAGRNVVWSSLLVLLCACGFHSDEPREEETTAPPAYVGREACAKCHPKETSLWSGSHHDLAMEEASESTVLGDFSGQTFTKDGVTSTFSRRGEAFVVETDGPDGELHTYEIAYTFGVAPLQQYLVAFPGGRYQALPLAWDSRDPSAGGGRWFHLYPDERIDSRDPLHWTKRLANWNLMCAECHSTGLRKNFDLEANRYDTTWSEIDVSCESCHGPGERHVAWSERSPEARAGAKDGLVVDLSDHDEAVWVTNMETGLSSRNPPRSSRTEIEACARCHARRSAEQTPYVPGKPLLDTHRLALLTDPLYFPDGQIEDEVYVYGSFLQSKMFQKGVTCKDCHDPHALSVRGEGNSVCAACHLTDKFDTVEHHHHEPGSKGASCIECHMPVRTYMVVDPRRDHSFRVPRPDLSVSLATPNACTNCHRDRSMAWAREAVVKWYGEDVPPHYGTSIAAGRRGLPNAGAALASLARNADAPGIVRATALSMLAMSPGPEAASTLRESLHDPDALVRLGALESAEMLPPNERHPALVPLLNDPIRSVRLEATRGLASVPRETFTPDQASLLAERIQEFRDAQLRNADWPESHMNLGNLYLARGELEEAERAYETALAVDPDFTRAYVNLADLYRVQSRDAEGIAVLEEAVAAHGTDADLHHALGLALAREKRGEEAVVELGRAAELRPDEPRYAYVYGVALESVGRRDRARDVLEAASARFPFDRDLLVALATLCRDRGETEEAIAYAKRLVELLPRDPGAQRFLAELEAARR